MFPKNIETTEIKQNPKKWGQGHNKDQCQKKFTVQLLLTIVPLLEISWINPDD